MATHTEGNYLSRAAGADLSAKQYYIVKTDASGNIVLAAAGTDKILGVLNNAPKNTDTADVAVISGNGTGKVIAGGSIAKDAYLTSDASGKAVATTTGGDIVFGRALAAASSGDVFEYLKLNEKY